MASATDSDPPVGWWKIHAFGLPAGSVRALLAILICGMIWALLLLNPDQEVPDYLRDLLFIIMGHYFAVRGRHDSLEEAGPPPLFLPNGTVRLFLVAGFVVVAVLLCRAHRLLPLERNQGVMTLILVGGFLLGVVFKKVATWRAERGHRLPRIVEDLRATVALAAATALVVLVWNRSFPFLHDLRAVVPGDLTVRLGSYGPEHVLGAVVGFYFGSRS